MPVGTTQRVCPNCKGINHVAKKICTLCNTPLPFKSRLEAAKRRYNSEWGQKSYKSGNASKAVSSAVIQLYKLSALGKCPLLLIGQKNRKGHYVAEVFSPLDSLSMDQKAQESIKLIQELYEGILTYVNSEQCPDEPTDSTDTTTDAHNDGRTDLFDCSQSSPLYCPQTAPSDTQDPSDFLSDELSGPHTDFIIIPADEAGSQITFTTTQDTDDSAVIPTANDRTTQSCCTTPLSVVPAMPSAATTPPPLLATNRANTGVPAKRSGTVKGQGETKKKRTSSVKDDATTQNTDDSADIPTVNDRTSQSCSTTPQSVVPVKPSPATTPPPLLATNRAYTGVPAKRSWTVEGQGETEKKRPSNVKALQDAFQNEDKNQSEKQINPEDCPVHNSQEIFSYIEILNERQDTEGNMEYLVRWSPCSACGVKWPDSWVPEEDLKGFH